MEDKIEDGNSNSDSKNLLSDVSNKLEKLLDQQSLQIDSYLLIIEKKIVGIEENVDSVSRKAASLEDVMAKIVKEEDIILLPDCTSGKSSYINEFCNNVSLPGLRYVGEGRESRSHKFVWIFLHLMALMISVSYIQNAYYRWRSSPVVQSVKNTLTKVDEIPFPAVTICEHISLKEEYNQWEVVSSCVSVENGTSWTCTELELDVFLISLDVEPLTFFHLSEADGGLYETSLSELRRQSNRTISGEEYHRYVDHISVEFTRWHCSPNSNTNLCGGSVNPVMLVPHEVILLGKPTWYLHKCETYNGLQHGSLKNTVIKNHSFQYNHERPHKQTCNWTPENMLEKHCRQSSKIIYTNEHVQFSTGRSDKTFFIVIHNPVDYPNLAKMKTFGIQRHKLLKMLISPKLVTAADDLTGVEVEKRGCVFSYEKSLTMFDLYTHQNCFLECQIICSLTMCGCIPQSIIVINSSVSVCTRECNSSCECDCPPNCVSLAYDVDLDTESSSFSSVKVEYRNLEFPSTFRYSVTSPAEFVAYSLGILGVFNGFSVMLVWEILYWLTLRLWTSIGKTVKPIRRNNLNDNALVQ